MTLPLLLLACGSLPCQSAQPDPSLAPETAFWIEAEGMGPAAWLGWGPSGPRRSEAPQRGPWLAIEFKVAEVTPEPAVWIVELADGARWRGEPGPDLEEVGLPTWKLPVPM